MLLFFIQYWWSTIKLVGRAIFWVISIINGSLTSKIVDLSLWLKLFTKSLLNVYKITSQPASKSLNDRVHAHLYSNLISKYVGCFLSRHTRFFYFRRKIDCFPNSVVTWLLFHYLHANSNYILVVFLDVSNSERSSLAHSGTHQSKVDPLSFYVCCVCPISNITLQFSSMLLSQLIMLYFLICFLLLSQDYIFHKCRNPISLD